MTKPMFKLNDFKQLVFAGDEEYSINCTGDACVGDDVKFSKASFSGVYPNTQFTGMQLIEGRIIKDSYGEEKQQHTFTIEFKNGKTLRIKGRNLYKEGLYRKPWQNETTRSVVLREKHQRGNEARALRLQRQDPHYYNPNIKDEPMKNPNPLFNPLIPDTNVFDIKKFTCKNCNNTKSITDFSMRKSKKGKTFIDPWCKQCRVDVMQQGIKRAKINRAAKSAQNITENSTPLPPPAIIAPKTIASGWQCPNCMKFWAPHVNFCQQCV